jgi:hypothetical protein
MEKEERQRLVDNFIKFDKRNPAQQESDFFSDFLLPNCPNLNVIHNEDSVKKYLAHFGRIFEEVVAIQIGFVIDPKYLADHPEKIVGIYRADGKLYITMQVIPEVLLNLSVMPFSDDHYILDRTERSLFSTFYYFDFEKFREEFPKFKEKYILKSPNFKPQIAGEQSGGFGGFSQKNS